MYASLFPPPGGDRSKAGISPATAANFVSQSHFSTACVASTPAKSAVGRSESIRWDESSSLSKAAVRPERMKRMSPPQGEKVMFCEAMTLWRSVRGMGAEVKGSSWIELASAQEA